MDATRSDIVIEIHLKGSDYVHSKLLLQTFDNLESALYASDRHDISMAAAAMKIPDIIRDASLERLRLHKNNRLLLTDARTGSIVITMLVAGIGASLLNKATDDGNKLGFTNSNSRLNLRDFFREHIDDKSSFIAENIRRKFSSKKYDVSVKHLPPSDDSKPNHIIVDLTDSQKIESQTQVGSISQELDKNR